MLNAHSNGWTVCDYLNCFCVYLITKGAEEAEFPDT